ncbi:hypothetical protein BTJ68_14359 [Hortaea werneckii EXF-2000]|uniref:Uncharacterized protein n=1 Tax=Hortaea werneckii EXF-2000 TaxID=1157616 RepID=A0A1Z5SPL3_HORWE|nr:hypothetical protein BTJ68_14359 [Hortaea werneckii EXF-2000]
MASKTPWPSSQRKVPEAAATDPRPRCRQRPARKEGGVDEVPGKAPVASDSGATNTGIDPGTNQPGEKGIKGEPIDPRPDGSGSNMK